MLYQLSYFRMSTLLSEWFAFLFCVAKIRRLFELTKSFVKFLFGDLLFSPN